VGSLRRSHRAAGGDDEVSRPDLYLEYVAAGGSDLIDADAAHETKRGIYAVERVLIHRLVNADANGEHWQGTPALADEVKMPRRVVRDCQEVLVRSGLMVDTGRRRGRAIVWALIPDVLAALRTDDVAPDVARHVARHVARDVARTRATKGREGKGGGRKPPTQPPLMQSQPTPKPINDEEPICTRHPSPRHSEPCRQCADWRRWQDDHALDGRPEYRPVRENVSDDYCAHGGVAGRCPICRLAEATVMSA